MEQNSYPVKETHQFNNFRNQFYAVISANLINFSHGCVLGWVTPALLLLTSLKTPLATGPITLDELSWIGSVNNAGAILGTFTFGCFTSLMGCKRAMAFLAIPGIGYWLTIMYADSANWIIFARFMAGWAGGGILSIPVLYVAEIADPKIRGTLGSIANLCKNIGMLTSYILAAFLTYDQIPFVLIVIPIVYMINFAVLPNTPAFWVKRGEYEKAEEAIKYYKKCDGSTVAEANAVYMELERMKSLANKPENEKKSGRSDIFERSAIKAIAIAIVLSLIKVITGNFIFLTYAGRILSETGNNINPYKSAIMLGVVQMTGSLCSTQVADKFGRKIILVTTLFATVLGQSVLSIFTYLQELDYDLSLFHWVPIASMSFVVFVTTVGVIPLTSTCTVEILPKKIRTIGITINTLAMNLSTFLLGKFFPIASETYGLYGCMNFLAGGCILSILFVIFILEETRGRDLNTIGNKSRETEKHVATIDLKV